MQRRNTGQKLMIMICFIMMMLLGGCAISYGEMNRYQLSSLELFDTVTVITGYAKNEEAFREKADSLLAELGEYHRLSDIYHDYEGMNNAKTINDRAGGEPVKVDSRLLQLLCFARELCLESNGKTDVTLGAMLRLWHEAREAGIEHPETAAPPDREALENAMAHTGMELLEIDETAGTVRLTDSAASLDLGSVAKGYAVQRVCEKCESGWLVNVGGNVYATGPKPDGSSWVVGIQDPDGNGSTYIHAVTLQQGAVVTSGDYQRYFVADGNRYHHLIDPDTRMPGDLWRAVTVLHTDSGTADGMSTSLFLMTKEEGEALLEKLGGEACWIGKDGQIFYSSGYEEKIRK